MEQQILALQIELQHLKHASQSRSLSVQSGDTAWLLLSCVLVLGMTLPGIALYYAGMVRVQNVLATAMQSFSIACVVTVCWMVCGYALIWSEGNTVFGYSSEGFLIDLGL